MKKHITRLRHKTIHVARKIARRPAKEEIIPESSVPRITNETIAEHREAVLSGARKYIYPLAHSKQRIVLISTAIFIVLTVSFVTFCTLSLYKFKSSSTFIYRVTQVVPFPVAHNKNGWVSYESYLFELRHYVHYYETQQKLDFSTEAGQQQLQSYRKQALQKVVDDSYVKKLASENGVSVTNQEVDAQIAIVRSQNRLGSSEKVFEDVLREFWGWSLNDFKRSLRQQLLAQKVANKLDTATHTRANAALGEIAAGANFGDVAKKYTDDEANKAGGGDFGVAIDRTNKDYSAKTTEALFALQPGQTSPVLDIGYALEIVRNNGFEGEKVKAAHILFKFKDINEYIKPRKDTQKTRELIKV